MRKITREAVSAFLEGRTFNRDNTNVYTSKELGGKGRSYSVMRLHGNLIANLFEDGELNVSDGGFPLSNTTKERLNGIPGVHVHTRNFVHYLNDEEWDGSYSKVREGV